MTDEFNEDFEEQLLIQMREDFLVESGEILDRLEPLVFQLEHNNDPELIHTIFREMHTLKGTASFVELDKIQDLAHKLEDIFGDLRDQKLSVTPDLIDSVFYGVHVLSILRTEFQGDGSEQTDIASALDQLEAVLQSKGREQEQPPQPTVPDVAQVSLPTHNRAETTLRVDVDTIDTILELVSELITARNALLTIAEQGHDESLINNAATIDRLTRQLYSTVTTVRLVPVEKLFSRFTGVVRNLARECGKQVNLVIEGADTPLDRTISERIYDPLIHLLRNAIDHGLESTAERKAQGKPQTGTVRLIAERQGDSVILRVSDDGAGINPDQVRLKAVERGLHTTEEVALLTDEQAIHLLFTPGFSTAKKITDISGRGVGLDVILQNVRQLRGTVSVDTAIGQGTTFVIELPLTLAILQVQLVRVGSYIYALPLHSVRETLWLSLTSIQTMQQEEIVFIRNVALPVRYLQRLLALPDSLSNTQNAQGNSDLIKPAIIIRRAKGEEILLVDELVGKQQVVIKSLSSYLGKVVGVEGAAILPDGSVTLILDVESLVQ